MASGKTGVVKKRDESMLSGYGIVFFLFFVLVSVDADKTTPEGDVTAP